jgi:hypothetical protein
MSEGYRLAGRSRTHQAPLYPSTFSNKAGKHSHEKLKQRLTQINRSIVLPWSMTWADVHIAP